MVNRDDWVAGQADGASDPALSKGAGGARTPAGWPGRLTVVLAFAWILFLLHSETGLSFWLHDTLAEPLSRLTGRQLRFVPTHADIKVVHAVFALSLVTLTFPLAKTSPRVVVPLNDWVLIVVTLCAAAYLIAFRYDIETRIGLLLRTDLVAGVAGLIVVFFAIFRAIGWPLLLVAGGLMLFAALGDSSFAPQAGSWDAAATNRALRAYWLEADGVFGRTLEFAVALIFPLALLAGLLERAGARVYFANVATAGLGHMRGGPAKAAVAASLLSGLYTPSARADAAACAPLTVPLMQHTGYGHASAIAIQQAASAHAQLLPPVMGAAAFLVADQTGVGLGEIAHHLLAPAVIAFAALFAFVHIDAVKRGLPGLVRQPTTRRVPGWALWLGSTALFVAAGLGAGYGKTWIETTLPQMSGMALIGIGVMVYLGLVWVASRRPDLKAYDGRGRVAELAPAAAVAATGLYYLLPIAFVIWAVLTAAIPATVSLLAAALIAAAIAATHHVLKALFRGQFDYVATATGRGMRSLTGGIVTAARLMAAVVVAAAGAGIVLGSAAILGLEAWFIGALEHLGSASFIFGLAGAAALSAVFGAGMPTAIGYLLAAVLVAPAVISMSQVAGFEASLPAVHIFLLFFVVAASHPAASLAKIGLVFPPLFFFVNPELLLIDVTPVRAPLVVVMAGIGAIALVAACQRHLAVRNKVWETAALIAVGFTLLHPAFWLDRLQPPFNDIAPSRIFTTASALPENARLNVTITGPENSVGREPRSTTVTVPLGAPGGGAQRLEAAGLTIFLDGDTAVLEAPYPDTPFAHLNARFDFTAGLRVQVSSVQVPARGRLPKQLFYLPALGLLVLVWLLQRRRRQD